MIVPKLCLSNPGRQTNLAATRACSGQAKVGSSSKDDLFRVKSESRDVFLGMYMNACIVSSTT